MSSVVRVDRRGKFESGRLVSLLPARKRREKLVLRLVRMELGMFSIVRQVQDQLWKDS